MRRSAHIRAVTRAPEAAPRAWGKAGSTAARGSLRQGFNQRSADELRRRSGLDKVLGGLPDWAVSWLTGNAGVVPVAWAAPLWW